MKKTIDWEERRFQLIMSIYSREVIGKGATYNINDRLVISCIKKADNMIDYLRTQDNQSRNE